MGRKNYVGSEHKVNTARSQKKFEAPKRILTLKMRKINSLAYKIHIDNNMGIKL